MAILSSDEPMDLVHRSMVRYRAARDGMTPRKPALPVGTTLGEAVELLELERKEKERTARKKQIELHRRALINTLMDVKSAYPEFLSVVMKRGADIEKMSLVDLREQVGEVIHAASIGRSNFNYHPTYQEWVTSWTNGWSGEDHLRLLSDLGATAEAKEKLKLHEEAERIRLAAIERQRLKEELEALEGFIAEEADETVGVW